MSAIGPGDWVEALNDEEPYFAKNSIWRVDRVWMDPEDEGCIGDPRCRAPSLTLFGMRMPPGVEAACACAFRPIYRPRADLIETLKQPAPDAVRELENV